MVVLGSKFAMPMIVLNLGGEMIYILNQRLQAQNIVEDKAEKVLQDVVKAMLSAQFVEELFRPQETYTLSATKQIFEKLAHSSIMRLNQSSMDKLFDLMTMGFKYQLLQCSSPQQYLNVLLLHLESIKVICRGPVTDLAQSAIDLSLQTYSTFTSSNWNELKFSLLRFIQGKKIKVSLFLQHRMQSLDGSLAIECKGKLPEGTDIPGNISFYEAGKVVATRSFASELRDLPLEKCSTFIDIENSIGSNMYAKGFSPDAKLTVVPPSCLQALKGASTQRGADSKMSASEFSKKTPKASAKVELNMLADMLGVAPQSESEKTSAPWRVNLFPDRFQDSKSDDRSRATGNDPYLITIDIDSSADSKSWVDNIDRLDFETSHSADAKSVDDDLLSLMDASK